MRRRILVVTAFCFLTSFIMTTHAESKEGGWVIVPFPIYTPETGLALTLTALRHFHHHEGSQTSSIMASGAYSLNHQSSIRLTPEISIFGGKGWFEGEVAFEYWPEEFYGIGHDSPESNKEAKSGDTILVFM